jgi:hypothetical protein
MPPVLQELMRHEAIETTMKFYVGQDAQSTAAERHRAMGQNTVGSLSGDPGPVNEERTHARLT